MYDNLSRLFSRFSRYGVLHREAVKNDLKALRVLTRQGLVQKRMLQGRVFYELTDQSLPVLDHERRKLVEEVSMRAYFAPELYLPLLQDVRFLDERATVAKEFLFLGDWQLIRPVVAGQLKLAKLRYYKNLPSRRRGASL